MAASVVSELVVNTGMLLVSRGIVHIRIGRRFPLAEAGALLGMSVVVILLRYLVLHSLIRFVCSVAFGGFVYLLCTIIMNNDVLLFWGITHCQQLKD